MSLTIHEKANSHADHITALIRYARGYDALPTPSRELAAAIVEAYWLLLGENEAQKCTIAALRTGAPVEMLEELPGLERWRRQVLDDPSRRPIERIAALELTAAQMKGEGDEVSYLELMGDAQQIALRSSERGHAA